MSSRREDAEGEARARATRDGDVAGEGVVRLARRRERGGGERGGGERGEVRRGRAGAVRVPVVPCVPAHAGWGLRGSRRLIIWEVGDATLVVSFSFGLPATAPARACLVFLFFPFGFSLQKVCSATASTTREPAPRRLRSEEIAASGSTHTQQQATARSTERREGGWSLRWSGGWRAERRGRRGRWGCWRSRAPGFAQTKRIVLRIAAHCAFVFPAADMSAPRLGGASSGLPSRLALSRLNASPLADATGLGLDTPNAGDARPSLEGGIAGIGRSRMIARSARSAGE